VVTHYLMETIKRTEVVAMPMLRVRCTNGGVRLPEDGWPTVVQCLPPIGALMDNSIHPVRAYVKSYCFFGDGHIELILSDKFGPKG